MAKYSYIQDIKIRDYIDYLPVKIQYTRILILNPINGSVERTIDGYATAGSINVNGSSSVRRTGSITLVADENTYDALTLAKLISEVDSILYPGRQIAIEVGIKNTGLEYRQYPIFWFPLGVFLISSPSFSHTTSGLTIQLKLNDKMSLLNGENGGSFSTAITHSPEKRTTEDGSAIYVKPLIKDLMYSLLTDIAGLREDEFLIEDLPEEILQTITWLPTDGVSKAYLYPIIDSIYPGFEYGLSTDETVGGIQVEPNGIMGKQYTDYVSPIELTSNFNDSIQTVLEAIKNALGNKEYFFDEDGVFHFRNMRTFLEYGQAATDLSEALGSALINQGSYASYFFKDGALVSAYANNPQWAKIKNDLVSWGDKSQLRYHLAIGARPDEVLEETWYIQTYKDNAGYIRASFASRAQPQNANTYNKVVTIKDWRRKLYFAAIETPFKDRTLFERELVENIPLMINLETGKQLSVDQIKYYLDIIDPTKLPDIMRALMDNKNNDLSPAELKTLTDFNKYAVEKIGRRSYVVSDDDINYLTQPPVPTVYGKEIVFLLNDGDKDNPDNPYAPTNRKLEELVKQGQAYCVLNTEQWKNVVEGARLKSAYDVLRSALNNYIFETSSISLTTIPIYHLDVNQRIYVKDEDSGIEGDYLIQSLSIPLATNGTMSISAVKAINMI